MTDARGEHLDQRAAARWLGLSVKTLRRLVVAGVGPGQREDPPPATYRLADLEAFVERCRIAPGDLAASVRNLPGWVRRPPRRLKDQGYPPNGQPTDLLRTRCE